MCLSCVHDAACPKAAADQTCGCEDLAMMLQVLPAPSPETMQAAELIREWYETFSVGGPLHVQLDDFNLDDEDPEYLSDEILEQGWKLYEDRRTPALEDLGRRLVALMRPLDQAQRHLAVGIAHFHQLAEWAATKTA